MARTVNCCNMYKHWEVNGLLSIFSSASRDGPAISTLQFASSFTVFSRQAWYNVPRMVVCQGGDVAVLDVCSVGHCFSFKSEFLYMRNKESISFFILLVLSAVEVRV